jgi:RNA polymerase sigma-70 factor, ECF subfamily
VAEARDAALPAMMGGGVRRRSADGCAGAADAALVRAAQGGSVEAMEELFRRYWSGAHRAAWLVVHDAALAEDVAQEAFLSAVRSLHRFDRRRPFGPWLHRIVVNRAIDHARAREVRREVPAELVGEPASMAPEGAGALSPDDLVGALAALPPEQRAVVVLRHLLGYTPGEIARLLALPRGTVNSRLRRGLDALAGPLRDAAPAQPRGKARS